MQSKKVLSIFTASLMVASSTFTGAAKVNAQVGGQNNKDAQLALVRQAYEQYLQKNKVYAKASASINDNLKRQPTYKPTDRVRVIVELNEKSVSDYVDEGITGGSISGKNSLQSLSKSQTVSLKKKALSTQASYKAAVSKIDSSVKFKQSYGYLLNGFSGEVQYKDIEAIKKIPGVKSVTLSHIYYPEMTSAKEITNVYKAWADSKYKGEGMVVSIVDSGIDPSHKDMKITDPSKEKIKDKNPTGKGKYFTDKVPYGYNFVDNNQNIVDTGIMHGMHCAGIVAANGDPAEVAQNKAIQGCAPEAQLLAMKVFSNDMDYPSANGDDIVAAIEDSVEHGADVINMSLGGDNGYVESDDPEQAVIAKAEQKGVLVVCAGGNSQYSTAPAKYAGIVDTEVISAPGLATKALSVAAFENTSLMAYPISYTSKSGNGNMGYVTGSPVNPVGVLKGTYDVVDCGLGTTEDFAKINVKGKIALIKRGGNTFVEKKLNAQAAGAVGVIVYNKDGETGYISMATDPAEKIPSVFITNEDGKKLLSLIGSGLNITYPSELGKVANPNAGNMCDFSSWGPTPDLDFKPQITAPGGSIYSTANDNKYQTMSGTSMATPHTAGIMALVFQHVKDMSIPGITPQSKVQIAKTIAMNTSKPQIDPATGSKLPFSPRRQGAGLIDAQGAVKDKVTITNENGEPSVALKEISGNTTTFKLNVKNYDNKAETYTVKDLSGVMTEQTKDTNKMSYDIKLAGATISFDKSEVTVPANGQVTVTATVKTTDSTPKNEFLEGFVSFVPKDSTAATLGVPYMGFYGKWDSLPIFDAPAWDTENTYLGTTTVNSVDANGIKSPLGVVGKDKDGNLIIDSSKIAMTTGEGKFNVVPNIALLRNAKTMIFEVLDSNNKVIRTLSVDSDMAKNMWTSSADEAKQADNYVAPSPDIWDLTAFNPATGKNELVKDGQYTIQVRAAIDYPNAQYQSVKLPIKIDSVAPTVKIVSNAKVASKGKYTVKFNASDDNSGVSAFSINVNGTPIKGADGNTIIKLKADANGVYSYDLNLDADSTVTVNAIDYAGNIGTASQDIAISNLNITSPADNTVFNNGNFTLNYTASADLIAKTDAFGIVVDKADPVDNGKNIAYTFKNLAAGKHVIKVNAYDKDSNVIDTASVNVLVKDTKLYVNFVGARREGTYYNTANPVLTGDVNMDLKSFQIQDKDVKVNSDMTFSAPVTLVNGHNKIHVKAETTDGQKVDYSINVWCDTTAPTLNIASVPSKDTVPVVYVSNEAESYMVNGSVSDNSPYVKVFVNDSEVLTGASINATSTKYSAEAQLTDNSNTIVVKAVDQAGNVTTKKLIVIKDSAKAPKLTISSIADGAVLSSGNINIEGNVSGLASGAAKLFINDKSFDLKSASINQDYSLTGSGEKTIKISVLDSQGNMAQKTINVSIRENNAPKVSILQPEGLFDTVAASVNSYTVRFSAEDESNIASAVVNGVNATVSDGGVYSATVSNLKSGINNIVVTVKDQFGNASTRYMMIFKFGK